MSNLNAAELERLTDLYCGRAAGEWAFLRESGAEIPLTDVYVMLQAAEEARREALDQSSDVVPLEGRLERAGVPAGVVPRVKPPNPPMPLEAALRETRRLVMLGESGSGKSTTLQYIGLCYAGCSVQTSLNLNESHVPVCIRLGAHARKIVRSKDGLLSVLAEAVGDCLPLDDKHQAGELLRAWNREGRLLVLLDGLDEVPEGMRSTVSGKIRSLHSGLGKMCRIVGASRRAGYTPVGSPFREFNLKPMEAKEARFYVKRWLQALGSKWDEDQADKEAGSLLEQMSDRPALRRLTDNPQILKLAAINYVERGGKLAANRSELYGAYVQSAYESREAPFSLDRMKEMLEDLAWAMHTEQMPEAPKEEIELVRQNTGLIAQVGEQLAFSHLTLKEYFVARRLAAAWKNNPEWTWRFIKPRLQLPEWHEPLLLLAGKLKEDASESLVSCVLKAGSAEEGLLARDLRMAAEMTAELGEEYQPIATQIVRQASRRRIRRATWNIGIKSIDKSPVILALGHVGEAALPDLREALKDPDASVILAAGEALGQIGEAALPDLREALKHSDGFALWVAAEALGRMGEAALPDLRKALKHSDGFVRGAATRGLGKIGEAALPELRDALKDGDPLVQMDAAEALGKMGEAALPVLLKALNEGYARAAAARALWQMDEVVLPALPELREALKDPEGDKRAAAAEALSLMGKAALPALPELREALKDPDRNVRSAAASALGKMGEAALPMLLEALKEADGGVRTSAVYALADVGEAAQSAVPELREVLKDPDRSVRGAAASVLGEMGRAALPALPELREALRGRDPFVQRAAAEALGKMGEAAVPALSELQEALKDRDGVVCQAAAGAITAILANTSSAGSLPRKQDMEGLLEQLISILRVNADGYEPTSPLSTALQLRERLWVKADPYRDPRQPPPRSRLERAASFAGYFLFFAVLLGLVGVLGVLSGSAGEVLGDQTTEGIKSLATDHPVWMLAVLVGLLAAAAGLVDFFLLDQIKERLKQWRSRG